MLTAVEEHDGVGQPVRGEINAPGNSLEREPEIRELAESVGANAAGEEVRNVGLTDSFELGTENELVIIELRDVRGPTLVSVTRHKRDSTVDRLS